MKIRNPYKGKTRGEIVVHTIASLIMGAFAFSYVFGFFWAVFAGANTHQGIVLHPFELPEKWQWSNYIEVFDALEVRGVNFIGMTINTLLMVLIMPLTGIGGIVCTAYAISRYRFPGRNFLLSLNLVTMTLPIFGGTAATLALYKALGMYDTPLLLLSCVGCFGGDFLFIMACFKGVSRSYGEAAKIDGAGPLRIMVQIDVPMAMGTISALWILALVARWNDSGTALLYWPNMPTLATGIYLFNLEMTYRVRMDIMMAATVVSGIPPLLLFAIFHKKMLSNISFGGLKG